MHRMETTAAIAQPDGPLRLFLDQVVLWDGRYVTRRAANRAALNFGRSNHLRPAQMEALVEEVLHLPAHHDDFACSAANKAEMQAQSTIPS